MSELFFPLTDFSFGQPYVLTPDHMALSMAFTFLLAAVMAAAYYICHDRLTGNPKFNITLVMLSFLSTVLLFMIRNNPLLSLGVLGSLSICRIRINTRDPRDLGFVFWALSIGISSATGAFLVGGVSSLVLAAFLFAFGRAVHRKNSLTLVVRGKKEALGDVQDVFHQTKGSLIHSKNLYSEDFELVYELRLPHEEEDSLILILNHMEGIHGVNVLAPETQVA